MSHALTKTIVSLYFKFPETICVGGSKRSMACNLRDVELQLSPRELPLLINRGDSFVVDLEKPILGSYKISVTGERDKTEFSETGIQIIQRVYSIQSRAMLGYPPKNRSDAFFLSNPHPWTNFMTLYDEESKIPVNLFYNSRKVEEAYQEHLTNSYRYLTAFYNKLTSTGNKNPQVHVILHDKETK